MYSKLLEVAASFRFRRRHLKLTQRQVAEHVGCSQSYLSQVETGRRPLSRKVGEKLETVLVTERGALSDHATSRGRRCLTPAARRVMSALRAAQGRPAPVFGPIRRPRFPRPDRVIVRENPFLSLETHLGGHAGEELATLQDIRCGQELFWRHLAGVGFNSWSEKWLTVRVGLTGAQVTGVRPAEIGCQLPVVNGKSGAPTQERPYPAFLLEHKDVAVAWFLQRAVRTANGYRWPDNLLVVSNGRHKTTAIVEVDGPQFHADPRVESRRMRELGVPVLRVRAQDVGSHNLVGRILEWARGLVHELEAVAA